MMVESINIAVRCPVCSWRVMDKISPATGKIMIKCPRCHRIGGRSGPATENTVPEGRLVSNITHKEEVTTE